MVTGPIKVPIQPLMHHITLNVQVTGQTTWRIRQWLGIKLLVLAARVMGCNLQVDTHA